VSSVDIERRVADYYANKLREHGATHRGVDWSTPESHALRHEQFLRLLRADEPVGVLDYGCGYGSFGEYLDALGLVRGYQGFDIAAEMIAAAREQHAGRAGWTFTSEREELEPTDVAIASGIFNVKVDTPAERWCEYTLETIQDLASLARRGLGFNLLTSYSDADRMEERLYYADPGFYFDWCKRNLSRHVALLHDYGLYEFTILVRFDA
jgi:SAM-dependent methyltransferase